MVLSGQFQKKNVLEKWEEIGQKMSDYVYSMDGWNGSLALLRQFLRGWGPI